MKLLTLLSCRFLLLALYILYGAPSLFPDEAQYWTWSQNLDWGYYSKPPGIAWQIYLSTKLFGHSEWGVRFLSLVIGTLTCWAVYWLARKFYDRRCAFWTAAAFAVTPVSLMGSVFAITDGGMLLCWLFALGFYVKGKWPLFGFFLGVGGLFKWPIYILPGVLLLWALYDDRKKIPFLLKGMALSLFALIPPVVWNVEHGFATFRHVGNTLGGKGNPMEFLGAQVFLLSPLFFAFGVGGFFFKGAQREVKRVTAVLIVPLVLSFFTKIQGNWADYALPTMPLLGIPWILNRPMGMRWVRSGTAVALMMGASVLFGPLPYRMNPLKNSLGHREIGNVLSQNGYDPSKDFLISDSYQAASLLSFYGPRQERAYFLNLGNRRLNQFSFWPGLEGDRRGEGFFAAVFDAKREPKNLLEQLGPYFSEVSYLGAYPLYIQKEQAQKALLLYHVKGYVGKIPETTPHY